MARKLLKRPEVIAIRRQYAAGHTIQEIATAYGRHWETIADCVHGRTYTRIKDVRTPPLPEPPRFAVPGAAPGARRGTPAVRQQGARKPAAPRPAAPKSALPNPTPPQPSGLAAALAEAAQQQSMHRGSPPSLPDTQMSESSDSPSPEAV